MAGGHGAPRSVLVLPFIIAAVLKSAQGSSTVAIMTTASMRLPLRAQVGLDTEV